MYVGRTVLLIVAVTLPASLAIGQTPHFITDLGDLGGGESQAFRLNSAGQVVGYATTWVDGSLVRHPFLYSSGTMMDLATPALGEDFGEAWGINDAGDVVGQAKDAAGRTNAFLYSGGSMIDIDPGFGGLNSAAYAVNDSDQVVGAAARKVTLVGFDHAFRWSDDGDQAVAPTEVLEILALDGNPNATSYARDVSAGGYVVGFSRSGIYDHPFFFRDGNGNGAVGAGELVDLGTLGGDAGNAYGVNAAGQVAGSAQTAAGETHAFLWTDGDGDWAVDPGEVVDLGTLGGVESRARAVNASGDVVGSSQLVSSTETRAFICEAGVMTELNDRLSPVDNDWDLLEAWDINDSGQIVGYGENPDGLIHAFLLSPAIPGDATLDRKVDVFDLATLANSYGQSGKDWTDADFTGEGNVDVFDLAILANNYGYGTGGQPIPEPATLALLALGSLALIRRK